MAIQYLVERRKVDEYRKGAVYKTHTLGEEWINESPRWYDVTSDGTFVCPLGTIRQAELQFKTMRSD